MCIMQVYRLFLPFGIRTVIISTRRQFISSFYFHKQKCNIIFWGVCFKTNSQYIPSLVSPLTSFQKKRKRKQNRKRKNTYRNQFYSDIVVDVYTHGIFPPVLFVMKFACLSIKCGRALMQDACSKYLILGPDSIGSPSQLNFSRKYSL